MINKVIDLIIKFSLAIAGHTKLQSFTILEAMLNLLGFNWVKGGINVPVPTWLKFGVYPASYPIMMCVVSYLTLQYNIELVPNSEFEIIKQINGFVVSMTFIAASFKVIFFRTMKQDILKLTHMCNQLGYLDAEKSPVYDTIRFSILYFILLNSNTGTWTVGYLWLHNDLPFDAGYPWDKNTPVGWSFVFFFDFLSAVFCPFCHSIVDIFFPSVVSIISGHMEILKKNLSKIGNGDWTDKERIGKSVEFHIRLLEVVKQTMVCYDKLFVIQSVYTVLHACGLIFAVVKVSDKLEATLSSVPMLSASYAQLYMYCSYGQMLTSTFDDLTFALYNNKWYQCPPKQRKSLVLFLEACKRPVSLRGFGNIRANLANYLHSLQESVSYFLILKTITTGTENL